MNEVSVLIFILVASVCTTNAGTRGNNKSRKLCGSDLIIYKTKCDFVKARCANEVDELTVVKMRYCVRGENPPKSNKRNRKLKKGKRPKYSKKICASNNQTYDNHCEFKTVQCEKPLLELKTVFIGDCSLECTEENICHDSAKRKQKIQRHRKKIATLNNKGTAKRANKKATRKLKKKIKRLGKHLERLEESMERQNCICNLKVERCRALKDGNQLLSLKLKQCDLNGEI